MTGAPAGRAGAVRARERFAWAFGTGVLRYGVPGGCPERSRNRPTSSPPGALDGSPAAGAPHGSNASMLLGADFVNWFAAKQLPSSALASTTARSASPDCWTVL